MCFELLWKSPYFGIVFEDTGSVTQIPHLNLQISAINVDREILTQNSVFERLDCSIPQSMNTLWSAFLFR